MMSYSLKTNSGNGRQQLYLQIMRGKGPWMQWHSEHGDAGNHNDAVKCSDAANAVVQQNTVVQWNAVVQRMQWCSEYRRLILLKVKVHSQEEQAWYIWMRRDFSGRGRNKSRRTWFRPGIPCWIGEMCGCQGWAGKPKWTCKGPGLKLLWICQY